MAGCTQPTRFEELPRRGRDVSITFKRNTISVDGEEWGDRSRLKKKKNQLGAEK